MKHWCASALQNARLLAVSPRKCVVHGSSQQHAPRRHQKPFKLHVRVRGPAEQCLEQAVIRQCGKPVLAKDLDFGNLPTGVCAPYQDIATLLDKVRTDLGEIVGPVPAISQGSQQQWPQRSARLSKAHMLDAVYEGPLVLRHFSKAQGAGDGIHRRNGVAKRHERHSEIVQDVSLARIDLRCAPEAFDRVSQLTDGHQNTAKIGMGFREIGHQGEDIAVADGRFLRPAQFQQGIAQIVVGFRQTRFQRNRLAITGNRLLRFSRPHQHHTQIVMDVRKIGLQCQRASATGHSLIQPALRTERQTQMGMIGGNPGILCDRLAKILPGLGMMSLLVSDNPQPVQAVGMPWLRGQDAPVKLLGFRETTIPVALDGSGEICPALAGPVACVLLFARRCLRFTGCSGAVYALRSGRPWSPQQKMFSTGAKKSGRHRLRDAGRSPGNRLSAIAVPAHPRKNQS